MAEKSEKQLVVGILAHVDSGKTTLSEAMLYRSGTIRKLGRVDHKDAFLDTDTLEKARGITIFSKQALLTAGNTAITLLDTPGHVDFSTETERTLQVLDYAVLVVSGTDGVQSHTETLWRLLRRYHVPTFVFVNKMDLPGKSREELLAQLNHRLGEGFVAFDVPQADRDEALALCDENLMDRMLDAGQLTNVDIIPAVARRHVFPCWFGAALKLEGVYALLAGLDTYTRPAPALDAFLAFLPGGQAEMVVIAIIALLAGLVGPAVMDRLGGAKSKTAGVQTADLEKAAELAVLGATKNSGQRCTAVKRILCVEAVADDFAELVVPVFAFGLQGWLDCRFGFARVPPHFEIDLRLAFRTDFLACLPFLFFDFLFDQFGYFRSVFIPRKLPSGETLDEWALWRRDHPAKS